MITCLTYVKWKKRDSAYRYRLADRGGAMNGKVLNDELPVLEE